MALFAGIDVGTSGARAVVIDEEGRVVGACEESYPLATPRPGWAEQDPARWQAGATAALGRAVDRLGARRRELRGIGFTGQMHSAVFLDALERVLRPAILWCDQRTERECDLITTMAGGLDGLLALTRNRAFPGFTAPKILWLREHEPDLWRQVRSVLVGKDYVRFRFTGAKATDVTDASGTLLLDVPRRVWSARMLELLEIDRALLPSCHESAEITGALTPELTRQLELLPGVPVFAGAGDQAAGAVAAGIVREGVASISLGTSGVVFAATARPAHDPSGALHSFCHAVPNLWHAMGVMLSAGGAVRWLRDVLSGGRELGYRELDQLAGESAPGARGLLFLPYLTGERTPILDAGARGVFSGLSLAHSRGELMRAVLEGVCLGLKDNIDLVLARGLSVSEVRLTGGGARSALFLQILADILQRPLLPLEVDEGPALGAALLAAVGAGHFADQAEASRAAVRLRAPVLPNPANAALYAAQHERFRDLYQRLRGSFVSGG